MHLVAPAPMRGWTRHPAIATLLYRAVDRFTELYPWSRPEFRFDPDDDRRHLLLTADEVRALDARLPATVARDGGHHDEPAWAECVRLATRHPGVLFAGCFMPPSRADDGVDLDAVYLPLPDDREMLYTLAITRPDGAVRPPDADDLEMIGGRMYRRLWWDGTIDLDPRQEDTHVNYGDPAEHRAHRARRICRDR